jgi:post-segregation antitoxin (ccd killing protein)
MAKEDYFRMRMKQELKEDLFEVAKENGMNASEYATEAITNKIKRHKADKARDAKSKK